MMPSFSPYVERSLSHRVCKMSGRNRRNSTMLRDIITPSCIHLLSVKYDTFGMCPSKWTSEIYLSRFNQTNHHRMGKWFKRLPKKCGMKILPILLTPKATLEVFGNWWIKLKVMLTVLLTIQWRCPSSPSAIWAGYPLPNLPLFLPSPPLIHPVPRAPRWHLQDVPLGLPCMLPEFGQRASRREEDRVVGAFSSVFLLASALHLWHGCICP